MQANWHNGLLYPAIPFPRTYFATRAELKKEKKIWWGAEITRTVLLVLYHIAF